MKKKVVSKTALAQVDLVFLPRATLLQKMAKAMKAMAAMKAMRAMTKKTVSKIARGRLAKVLVLRGTKEKTVGGLTAKHLTKNKHGRVVSKKASLNGKKHPWMVAVKAARSALKIKGFCAIKKGTLLYKKAKELYAQ